VVCNSNKLAAYACAVERLWTNAARVATAKFLRLLVYKLSPVKKSDANAGKLVAAIRIAW
jgi:hypothetical protein